MIKKSKLILISTLIIIAFACVIAAGCSFSLTLDDVLNEYGLNPSVTYFLNSGTFEDETQQKTMYYRVGSKPFNIGVDELLSGSAAVKPQHGYEFTGWYTVKLDSEGHPLYSNGESYNPEDKLDSTKGGIQFTDEPFDFSKPLEEGQHYYVCATWGELVKLRMMLVCEGFDKLVTTGGVEYKTGDEVRDYLLTSDQSDPVGNYIISGMDRNAYTFVAYYEDIECTKRFTDWPIKAKTEGDDEILYAKFIEGKWNIVETANQVQRMFAGSDMTPNYYFMSDIDCSSLAAVNRMNMFGGKIVGNGHTVKNLKVTSTDGFLAKDSAAFGEITETAEISDIAFENLTVEFDIRDNAQIDVHFVFTKIANEAKISNFEVGGKLIINLNSGSSVFTRENSWLFGDYGADHMYTGNISVTDGTTCKINKYDGTSETYEYQKQIGGQ